MPEDPLNREARFIRPPDRGTDPRAHRPPGLKSRLVWVAEFAVMLFIIFLLSRLG
jgi:hypothetical protein